MIRSTGDTKRSHFRRFAGSEGLPSWRRLKLSSYRRGDLSFNRTVASLATSDFEATARYNDATSSECSAPVGPSTRERARSRLLEGRARARAQTPVGILIGAEGSQRRRGRPLIKERLESQPLQQPGALAQKQSGAGEAISVYDTARTSGQGPTPAQARGVGPRLCAGIRTCSSVMLR